MKRAWHRFRRLTWRERARLGEAVTYLAAARLALLLFSFRQLAPRLGAPNQESPAALATQSETAQARNVGWAVTSMSRFVPWDSACLAQAVAANWMLQTRHIPSTLYLGVAYDEHKEMLAHAWLRCGEVIVTGAPVHRQYTVVARFAGPDQ